MWINVIDYRGDDTIVNSRGDRLFDYRTRYFFKQQEDFHRWKTHGHRFRCFTQHHNRTPFLDDYSEFDDVQHIPRGNAAQSRNRVLDFYEPGEWIGIWDNDATLYFDKLDSLTFVKDLDSICVEAQQKNIASFVPFDASQAPYPRKPKRWRPCLNQKTTMLFAQVSDWRFDETLCCLEDLEFACRLSQKGVLFAQTELCSLKELVKGKSTIFTLNAHHSEYKNPGPNANPKGLLIWDAQLDRKIKYQKALNEIERKLGKSLRKLKQEHKLLWKQ
jgi:hypothetical protein